MLDKMKDMLGMKTASKDKELSHRDIMLKEKKQATKNKKPWVGVLDTQVNADNIRNGFFELDWNNEFIEQLLDAGYSGETNEQIVDAWFKTIARNILEEQGLDPKREAGHIKVNKRKDGKSEIS